MARTIILHYHLFKNAGTSVDAILKKNFGSRWVTREFEGNPDQRAADLRDWIVQNPAAVAFSSHTMRCPVPQIEGVNIVSIMFLRDPIQRLRSAYSFERVQKINNIGANLASTHSFEGYVRARLEMNGDRQCRNFQTAWFAGLVPGQAPELDRAAQGLKAVSVVGLVEEFDLSLERLSAILKPAFPSFTWDSVRANVSKPEPKAPESPEFVKLLNEVNQLDYELLKKAKEAALI